MRLPETETPEYVSPNILASDRRADWTVRLDAKKYLDQEPMYGFLRATYGEVFTRNKSEFEDHFSQLEGLRGQKYMLRPKLDHALEEGLIGIIDSINYDVNQKFERLSGGGSKQTLSTKLTVSITDIQSVVVLENRDPKRYAFWDFRLKPYKQQSGDVTIVQVDRISPPLEEMPDGTMHPNFYDRNYDQLFLQFDAMFSPFDYLEGSPTNFNRNLIGDREVDSFLQQNYQTPLVNKLNGERPVDLSDFK